MNHTDASLFLDSFDVMNDHSIHLLDVIMAKAQTELLLSTSKGQCRQYSLPRPLLRAFLGTNEPINPGAT